MGGAVRMTSSSLFTVMTWVSARARAPDDVLMRPSCYSTHIPPPPHPSVQLLNIVQQAESGVQRKCITIYSIHNLHQEFPKPVYIRIK